MMLDMLSYRYLQLDRQRSVVAGVICYGIVCCRAKRWQAVQTEQCERSKRKQLGA
jgi:hypothetical protein